MLWRDFCLRDKYLYTAALSLALPALSLPPCKMFSFLFQNEMTKAGWMLAVRRLLLGKSRSLSVHHSPHSEKRNNSALPNGVTRKLKWVNPCEELRTHGDSHTSVSQRWSKRQHTCTHLLPQTELCVHARWTGLPFCANCICFAFILSKHHAKVVNYERQKGVISLKTKLNTLQRLSEGKSWKILLVN